MHPLDAKTDRKNYAQQEQGLGMCNITKCCTEVCPEHIKITDNAIIPMKERVVDNKYDPLVWLGRKIFRRDQLSAEAPAAHAAHTVPDHVDTKVVPRNVVWHQASAKGMNAEVGTDGRMAVSEVAFDRPGAASPFGENVTFPLSPSEINYQHPEEDDDH
jgi:succinate dehydrogenase / fumarate reductase iron-sulfur subunit